MIINEDFKPFNYCHKKGRKKLTDHEKIDVRFSVHKSIKELLDKYCEETGVSLSKAVKTAVENFVEM